MRPATDRPILVVGAAGMLGRAVAETLRGRGRDFEGVDRETVDIADPGAAGVLVARLRPGGVVNCAAFTDVARCEAPEARAEVMGANRDGPAALARACAALGAPFLHVSTDYVFDGTATRPYREDDPVHPVQMYGFSKLEGERAARAALPGSLVVRLSTLYGPGDRPRPHYVDAVLAQVRTKSEVEVVETPVSSPTYAPDAAAFLVDLLEAGAEGIFHLVNDGGCSRLELARAIAEEAGLGEKVVVRGKPEPPSQLKRPLYSVLDTGKLHRTLGRRPRPWRDALREYLRVHRGAPR